MFVKHPAADYGIPIRAKHAEHATSLVDQLKHLTAAALQILQIAQLHCTHISTALPVLRRSIIP